MTRHSAGTAAPTARDALPDAWKLLPLRMLSRLDPLAGYGQPRHLRYIERKIVGAIADQPGYSKRLIVSIPPQHGKSTTISLATPIWTLELWPNRRIVLASYESNYAESWGGRVRDTIERNAHQLSVRIKQDTSAKGEWETTAGGGMVSRGIRGGVTGRTADVLIIDDPIGTPEQANSPAYLKMCQDFYQSVAQTRLSPNAVVIVVMTRWTQDDLAGWLTRSRSAEGWDYVRLPALAEADDPLGRKEGEALFPERYDKRFLETIRDNSEPHFWYTMYGQKPTAPGGSIHQRSWFTGRSRYHPNDAAVGRRALARYISIDAAFKTGGTASYSAAVVGELTREHRLWIRHVERDRLRFDQLVGWTLDLMRRWNYDGKLELGGVIIEDKAAGISLIQTLVHNLPDPWPPLILPYMPLGDKDQRARSAAVWMRNDSVWLPAAGERDDVDAWLEDFEGELFSIPASLYRDSTDAAHQLIDYLELVLAEGWRERGSSDLAMADIDYGAVVEFLRPRPPAPAE